MSDTDHILTVTDMIKEFSDNMLDMAFEIIMSEKRRREKEFEDFNKIDRNVEAERELMAEDLPF